MYELERILCFETINVPENVVLEILLRLPARSVLRFICVCKRWRALIKSSLFKDKHLALKNSSAVGDDVIVLERNSWDDNRNLISQSFVNCWDYESLTDSVSSASSSYDFEVTDILRRMIGIYPWSRGEVINHVNGIFCVVGGEEGNCCSITLLNPTIREFRTLPVPDLGFKWYTQGFGFGFDDATNDYKVVGIVTVEEGVSYGKHIGIVYRLSTNSWSILGEIPAFLLTPSPGGRSPLLGWYPSPSSCTFAHGSVQWLVTNGSVQWLMSGVVYRILAFNMTTESFQEIQFPHAWKDDYDYEIIAQLFSADRSTITLVAYYDPSECEVNHCLGRPNPTFLDVWVMKEYGVTESWTKQYSVSPFPVEISSIFCFWRKDKVFLKTREYEWICYDLSKGEVYQPYFDRELVGTCYVGTCIESFVSIKEI